MQKRSFAKVFVRNTSASFSIPSRKHAASMKIGMYALAFSLSDMLNVMRN